MRYRVLASGFRYGDKAQWVRSQPSNKVLEFSSLADAIGDAVARMQRGYLTFEVYKYVSGAWVKH